MAKRVSTTQSQYENEEWRPVVGYEDSYQVSSEGRVRSVDRVVTVRCGCGHGLIERRLKGRILASSPMKGYPMVALSVGNEAKSLLVHRLVCEAFHGPAPDGKNIAAHNDGDASNASAENIRWASQKENIADQLIHGTRLRGDDCPWAKINREEVSLIRQAPRGKVTATAKSLGISREYATEIRIRKKRGFD